MNFKRLALIVFVLLALVVIALVGYRVISGRSLNLMDKVSRVGNIIRSVLGHNAVIANNGQYKNIIFIHHSVGHNLIEQGKLREQFQQLGYSFWDQDYMEIGLTGPDGKPTGYSYDIPGDNTDIDGYAAIFQQPIYGLPINAFSAFLQHEVIIFKSCYPNSQIDDDVTLELRKQEYLQIRRGIDQHQDKVFILLTSPPLNPAETNPNSAKRARILSNWLSSKEFLAGYSNLFVFDYFSYLAENDPKSYEFDMLKKIFRDGIDSHPNKLANEQIAPILVEFLNTSVEQYQKELIRN